MGDGVHYGVVEEHDKGLYAKEEGIVSYGNEDSVARILASREDSASYDSYSDPSSSDDEDNKGEQKKKRYRTSKRAKEVEVLSGRIFLPFLLTTKVEEHHKWNSEFQELYDKVFIRASSTQSIGSTSKEDSAVEKEKENGANENQIEEKAVSWSTEKESHLLLALNDMGCLYQDFLRVAKLYAELIVNELFLAPTERTLNPVNVGGIAGGDKYIAEGIFFKCVRTSANFYGGLANASKSPGHELKSQNELFNLHAVGLHFPLFVCIDYRGYRISAMSLLPVNSNTIKYGSADGGKSFHQLDGQLNVLMDQVGQKLNLRSHLVGNTEPKTTRLPADIEGHKAKDGRYYMLDTARVFPPEPRSVQGSLLYRLLRPELVRNYSKPLCSDAATAFDMSNERAEHKEDIGEAHEYLKTQVIPNFAEWLVSTFSIDRRALCLGDILDKYARDKTMQERRDVEWVSLKDEMHKRGINLRLLGLVWEAMNDYKEADEKKKEKEFWLVQIGLEIVVRAAKSVLNALMQRALESIKAQGESSFKRVAVEYLNLLLGDSEDSQDYWQQEFSDTIYHSFFYKSRNLPSNFIPLVSISEHRSYIAERLTRATGIVIEPLTNRESPFSSERFAKKQPFDDNSIGKMVPIVKCMDVVTYSNVVRLFTQLQTANLLQENRDGVIELFHELRKAHSVVYRERSWWIHYELVKITILAHDLVRQAHSEARSSRSREHFRMQGFEKLPEIARKGFPGGIHPETKRLGELVKKYEALEDELHLLRARLYLIENGEGALNTLFNLIQDDEMRQETLKRVDLLADLLSWKDIITGYWMMVGMSALTALLLRKIHEQQHQPQQQQPPQQIEEQQNSAVEKVKEVPSTKEQNNNDNQQPQQPQQPPPWLEHENAVRESYAKFSRFFGASTHRLVKACGIIIAPVEEPKDVPGVASYRNC